MNRLHDALTAADAVDFGEAAQVIAHLPLHQPVEAETRLAHLLNDILARPPAADELFSLLEYARTSLHFVRATAVRHYHEQAPHLEENAEIHFQRGLQLWQRVVEAYTRCLKQTSDDDARLAILLHRCMMYSGMQILEHYRAKRQVPPGLWRQLHQTYVAAEKRGVARTTLEDELPDETQTPHCQALYIAHLLTEVAQPYSRSPADLNLIWQWADRYAHLARLVRPRISAEKVAFVATLDGDHPLQPRPGGGDTENVRGLHTKALVQQLRDLLSELDQPASEDRQHLSAETLTRHRRLLNQLIGTWALNSLPRRYKRTRASDSVTLATTFHGIHAVLDRAPEGEQQPKAQATEQWQVIDHNPGGFRLARETNGMRIDNTQLVALYPHDGGEYFLGQVQWLMREQSGQLLAGIAAIPGLPRSVAIAAEERFKGQVTRVIRAFLLPATPYMQSEASIVLPPGFYQAGRVIEVEGNKLRLEELIQRGTDFERATYQRVTIF